MPASDGKKMDLESESEVWEGIRKQAGLVAAAEPLLAARLLAWVVNAPSPEAILANVLGAKLGNVDLGASALAALCLSVYRDAPGLVAEATADIRAVMTRDPATLDELTVVLSLKGFHALQVYRVCHALWNQGRRQLALVLAQESALTFGIDIHPGARIATGIMLDHGTGIVIGETAVVCEDVSILQGVTLGGTGKESGDRHPKVGRGVLIGAGAKILGNIQVGEFSKVAAGSVVLADVPARTTVAGVPARVVRRHEAGPVPSFEMDQNI